MKKTILILAMILVNTNAFGFDISQINNNPKNANTVVSNSEQITSTYLKRLSLDESGSHRKFNFQFSGTTEEWTSFIGTNLFGLKQLAKLTTANSNMNRIINSKIFSGSLCEYKLKNYESISDTTNSYILINTLDCKNVDICEGTGSCALQMTYCKISGEVICNKNPETKHLSNEEILKSLLRNM